MAMIRRSVRTVSTSRADDGAFGALFDASNLIDPEAGTRVVGGQMVALLLAAYPAPEMIARRTSDADIAAPTMLASTGELHARLTSAGYRATAGNSYSMGDRSIDVLVPAPTSRFAREEHGGRMFDAAPGVGLALAAVPILLEVEAMLLDDSVLEFEARVPTPEIAVILKAYTTTVRGTGKDIVDLHNLLTIADAHAAGEIGGWALDRPGLAGTRRDVARVLHRLATGARWDPAVRSSGVNPARLAALIRKHIAAP